MATRFKSRIRGLAGAIRPPRAALGACCIVDLAGRSSLNNSLAVRQPDPYSFHLRNNEQPGADEYGNVLLVPAVDPGTVSDPRLGGARRLHVGVRGDELYAPASSLSAVR